MTFLTTVLAVLTVSAITLVVWWTRAQIRELDSNYQDQLAALKHILAEESFLESEPVDPEISTALDETMFHEQYLEPVGVGEPDAVGSNATLTAQEEERPEYMTVPISTVFAGLKKGLGPVLAMAGAP